MAILLVFIAHSTVSVFFQSFFLHRYAAHRMFTMSKRWERTIHLLTYVVQGSSYLEPKGYALLHRLHHAYSDTPKDPHSPRNFKGPAAMMLATAQRYHDLCNGAVEVEPRYRGGYPEWRALDRFGGSWPSRLAWGAAYTLFYAAFATAWWQFLLLPVHWVLGPMHGAIVNWCGHRYGYRNFDSDDDSRNTLALDVVTMGELFQNNHHRFPQSPNFAVRRFELDPTYQVMRLLAWLGVIQLSDRRQIARMPPKIAAAKG